MWHFAHCLLSNYRRDVVWRLLGAKQRSSCGFLELAQVIFAGRPTASLRKDWLFYVLQTFI
jgi:hypothetical protein